jgi:hypothetical protein
VVLGKLKVLNLVQQFLQWLVQQYHKMLKTFSGWYYYCYKVAIAALVPGAGQGSITAASQTATAVFGCWTLMVFFAKVLYDNAAIGGYIKVTGTTVTSANIAAECAKIYSVIPPENLADTVSPVVIYAPRAWKQLIRIANNSVGAAQQVNSCLILLQMILNVITMELR